MYYNLNQLREIFFIKSVCSYFYSFFSYSLLIFEEPWQDRHSGTYIFPRSDKETSIFLL